MTEVSLIGTGTMGMALGHALLEKGFTLTVWNRTPERASPLTARGATLAPSVAKAVIASPVSVICIRSHAETLALLKTLDAGALAARTVVELSTGDVAEAGALSDWLAAAGADWLIGMISTFPKDIGKPDTAIVMTGPESAWNTARPLLLAMGGSSSRIGPDPGALAALYAALFLPRQGFMFGMLYGALACAKAGISMEDYVAQIPLTMKVVEDYYALFADTVPARAFDDPPCSMATYGAAFRDVSATFARLGLRDELPRLLEGLIEEGLAAGHGDRQITALTDVLKGTTA